MLDEPSTGLHPQDLAGLLNVLDRLVRAGATVVVVEHNTEILRAADWVIDLGPGAGPAGGELLYAGPPGGLLDAAASLTGQALREEAQIQPNLFRGRFRGALTRSPYAGGAHTTSRVTVEFPRGLMSVVTGYLVRANPAW